MKPGLRVACGVFLLLGCSISSQRAASPNDPDKDPQALKLLQEARRLIQGKQLPEAIEKCDQVIASFKTRYEGRKEKIYCARTSAESLGYLLKAASDKVNAISLSATWADAYFIRAYALQDLGRFAEAKATVQLALELSPMSSHYLSELGHIYQSEKNWSKAEASFAAAEDNAPLSPDDVKAEELGRERAAVWLMSLSNRAGWRKPRKSICNAWRRTRRTPGQRKSWRMFASSEPKQRHDEHRAVADLVWLTNDASAKRISAPWEISVVAEIALGTATAKGRHS